MRYFDLHCDTILGCYYDNAELVRNTLQVDLERGRAMNTYVQCYAVFLPDDIHGEAAFERFCQAADRFSQEIQANQESVVHYKSPEDLCLAEAEGKCCAILTVEYALALGGKLENIKELAHRGVKVCTLTWNGENELGRGVRAPGNTGLTTFGRQAVAELERWGIIPDVSHASPELFYDAMDAAKGPLVATHSNAKTICNHPRNLTDEQFAILKDRGGLVGLNLYGPFLRDTGKAALEDILYHAEHFLALGGEDVLAFGADWDGGPRADFPVSGIEGMEAVYNMFLRHNYAESLVEKLFYGNAAEFFKRRDLF